MYSFEQQDRLPSRRSVLRGGLAGAFVLGFHLPAHAVNEPEQPPDSTQGKFAPNAFIRIDHSGLTTLVMPQVEMGQGVYTAVAMILAEELDADFSKVAVEHAPPNDKLYGNPTFGIQVTGNSNSIRAFWKPLARSGRRGAAHARSRGGTTMASRSGELLGVQRRHQPRIEWAQRRLW